MPTIVAAVATALTIGKVAATFIVAALSVGASLAIGAITRALSPKPRIPSFGASLKGRTVTVREPIRPRQVIYGQVRVGGTITFLHASDDNQFLYMVVTFAGHPVEEIVEIFFNDESVPLDSSGEATGKYAGLVTIKKGLGTTATDSDWINALVADVPTKWTTNHRQEGCTKIYAKLKFNRDLFSSIPNITAVIKGKQVFDPRDSETKWTPNAALCLRDYLLDTSIGFGDKAANIDDTVWAAEANICEETVALVSQIDTFTVDTSTDEITLDGLSSGDPDEITGLAYGNEVQFTTDGTLPTELALSTTYYWIRLGKNRGKVATDLANALAGIAIDLTDTGTGTHTMERQNEKRYMLNGAFETDLQHKNVIGGMLSASMGRMTWQGGLWILYTGVYRTPTVTFDENDIVAPINVQSLLSKRDLVNRVKGIYVNPDNLYQPDDFPQVTNVTYLNEDLGDPLWLDMELEFTTSSGTAQRLAKIELERTRQQISLTVSTTLKGLLVKSGDTINLSYARFGWVSKPFEIMGWRMGTADDENGVPVMSIVMDLRETASSIYDWNSGEETVVDPAPNTNLPDPNKVFPPQNVQITSGTDQLFVSSSGTIISRMLVQWEAPPDFLVDAYEVQFKKDGVFEDWGETSTIIDQTRTFIGPVQDEVEYDVRVRSVNVTGARSDWAVVENHRVTGKTEKPLPPDTFTVSVDADGTRRFEWTHAAPEADVKAGGGYKIRYFLGDTNVWEQMTPLHEGLVVISPFETNALAAGTYTFAIKSEDSTGNVSANAVFISAVALANPRIANAILQRNERTEKWNGTLTDCFVNVENEIEAMGAQTWDDLPATFDALSAEWKNIVTSKSPIIYETPEIDLGGDFTFNPLVSIQAEGTVQIEMQVGTEANGGVIGTFQGLDTVAARYLKIRVTVTGTTPSIATMVIVVDSPAAVEIFNDVNTASTVENWFEKVGPGHFFIHTRGNISRISQARINAIQHAGAGAGWSWELISKFGFDDSGNGGFGVQPFGTTPFGAVIRSAAAEFQVYDKDDAPADTVVDIELRGAKV